MKKHKIIFTYCFGTGCPLKESCVRFKENINKKREDFFGITPYDEEKKRCTHLILKSDQIEDGGTVD